jgi:cadmium resistance protein CadD (predicted permease)
MAPWTSLRWPRSPSGSSLRRTSTTLFLLVAWFAAGRPPTVQVVVGQFIGIGPIVAASTLAAVAATAIGGDWVRLLGVLPITIGVRRLVLLIRGRADDRDEAKASAARGVVAVVSLTIANGGDNLSVYTPVFATHPPSDLAVIVAAFGVLTGLWSFAAFALVNHPYIGAPFRRYGHALLSHRRAACPESWWPQTAVTDRALEASRRGGPSVPAPCPHRVRARICPGVPKGEPAQQDRHAFSAGGTLGVPKGGRPLRRAAIQIWAGDAFGGGTRSRRQLRKSLRRPTGLGAGRSEPAD